MKLFENKIFFKISLILNVFLFFLLISLFFSSIHNKKLDTKEESIVAMSKKEEEKVDECAHLENEIFVDIKGNVKNPGVYKVSENAIIKDVIDLAGGALKGSSLNNINLSKKVKNEMVIYIYTDKELKKLESINKEEVVNNINNESCNCETEKINVCEGASIITTNESETDEVVDSTTTINERTNSNDKISINTASLEELMSISGIGESKAKSIIEYRNSNGSFKNIEEIKNVSGIGTALYEKIKEYITV